MHPNRIVFVLALLSASAGMATTARLQGPQLVGAAPVTHVGIVVRNIDETARQFERVMGFPAPTVTEVTLDLPDGRKTKNKVANMYMPNFHLELVQPMSNFGPHYDHLKQHGMGIQHLGLDVTGRIDDLRMGMEQKGGRWVLGAKGGNYAYVNFRQNLGTTFELFTGLGGTGFPPPPLPAGDALPPLAALPVRHVGFAVKDVDAILLGYADVFGVTTPKAREYRDSQYPPNNKWDSSAYLRLASWQQKDIGLEVMQSMGGPTPWSDYVEKQKGTAAQHVAITVGDRMDEMIRDLQAKGGKWTNGKAGGSYAYLDFMDTLGLIFELNGTSKSAPPAK